MVFWYPLTRYLWDSDIIHVICRGFWHTFWIARGFWGPPYTQIVLIPLRLPVGFWHTWYTQCILTTLPVVQDDSYILPHELPGDSDILLTTKIPMDSVILSSRSFFSAPHTFLKLHYQLICLIFRFKIRLSSCGWGWLHILQRCALSGLSTG